MEQREVKGNTLYELTPAEIQFLSKANEAEVTLTPLLIPILEFLIERRTEIFEDCECVFELASFYGSAEKDFTRADFDSITAFYQFMKALRKYTSVKIKPFDN